MKQKNQEKKPKQADRKDTPKKQSCTGRGDKYGSIKNDRNRLSNYPLCR